MLPRLEGGWLVHQRGPLELPGGQVVWQVDGANGENMLLARGATLAEAYQGAVEQALACGMLRFGMLDVGDG